MRRRKGKPGWVLAKEVLQKVLQVGESSLGRIRFLGDGIYNHVYYLDWKSDKFGGSKRRIIVRLPNRDAPKDGNLLAKREVAVLNFLANKNLSIRVPKLLGTVSLSHGSAFVQEMIFGIPIEMRAPRNVLVKPWEVIARAAVLCHKIHYQSLENDLPAYPTRYDHANATIKIFDDLDVPEAHDSSDWCKDHLPPKDSSRLLHGDLLGQNILMDIEDKSLGVIDWANARIGDPAYDLAIVTRGKHDPFQVKGGLQKLLVAYNAESDVTVTKSDVQLHELCLQAEFYKSDVHAYGLGSPAAENTRAQWRNVLRRAQAEEIL